MLDTAGGSVVLAMTAGCIVLDTFGGSVVLDIAEWSIVLTVMTML